MPNIAPLPHWYRTEPRMPKRPNHFRELLAWLAFVVMAGAAAVWAASVVP